MNGTVSLSKSWVFRLIVVNVIIYILQMFLEGIQVEQTIVIAQQTITVNRPAILYFFSLTPANVIEHFYVWQLCTYMFLHGSFIHLFLNMYALFLFGIPIEHAWGSRKFLIYYFYTGIGAGIVILLFNLFLGGVAYYIPTAGASGAVFGILLAFGIIFPDVELIMLFIPIPIKARFMVMIYGGIEIVSLVFSGGQGNISHIGHIGGLLFGIVYFVFQRKHGIRFKAKMMRARIQRDMGKRESKRSHELNEDKERLRTILQKVKTGGPAALTDDEYQHIRYLGIMLDSDANLCIESDFGQEDDYCRKCTSYEACMLREIKKYL